MPGNAIEAAALIPQLIAEQCRNIRYMSHTAAFVLQRKVVSLLAFTFRGRPGHVATLDKLRDAHV